MRSLSILVVAYLITLASAFTPSTRSTTTLTRTVYVSRCDETTSTTSAQFATPTEAPRFELREIVVDQAGNTILATQYPSETTAWFPTKISDLITWIPVEYTQTFATTALDQLPGPLVGKIGTEKLRLPEATGRTNGDGGRGDMRVSWLVAVWAVLLTGLGTAM